MKKLFSILISALFLCTFYLANAQSFTNKDFKLLLDGKDFSKDSSISVNDLLKLKEVTANFSWLSIKEIIVYFDFRTDDERSSGLVYDGITWVPCAGNIICNDAKKPMKGLKRTNVVTIQAHKATDKSGSEVNISTLTLHIE